VVLCPGEDVEHTTKHGPTRPRGMTSGPCRFRSGRHPMSHTDAPVLLFGSYHPPAMRRGDRTYCLVRDAHVVVTSWSDGRISWPRCRTIGHRGGSGLLVEDELARAIKSESALALMYWWGVTNSTVWKWKEGAGSGRPGRHTWLTTVDPGSGRTWCPCHAVPRVHRCRTRGAAAKRAAAVPWPILSDGLSWSPLDGRGPRLARNNSGCRAGPAAGQDGNSGAGDEEQAGDS
jgi:hypothetical protein